MTEQSIGVAVIGAGMAGRAHASAYRAAGTVFDRGLPPVRLVAIADANGDAARDAADRYGYERAVDSWEAVADAPDVDVVSIVVANHLHRPVAEALLAAGKHVLCEKPLAPTRADADAMVAAAEASGRVAATALSYRRSPAFAAVKARVDAGDLGRVVQLDGHYWCDYATDPDVPLSWRYRGRPGSGIVADVGCHVLDMAEQIAGPVEAVMGAAFATAVTERPVPLGAAVRGGPFELSGDTASVENEDVATFTVRFAGGALGSYSLSRIAMGRPNSVVLEVFGERAAARVDFDRPAEFAYVDTSSPAATAGYRTVLIGPVHPYVDGGTPMPFPGVGHGIVEFFVYQARAFLEQVAGVDGLPRCATFADGARLVGVLDAIAESAAADGKAVTVR